VRFPHGQSDGWIRPISRAPEPHLEGAPIRRDPGGSSAAVAAARHTLAPVDGLVLRAFEREQLALVEPWFLDSETNRWLGGPDWPRLMRNLADRALGEFRSPVLQPKNWVTESTSCPER
jgi:hypothetical protein